jgi:5'-nucleotidase
MKRQRILLTNDDGYGAAGIALLYQALAPHYDVTVVAPETEQSGIGHAFTFSGSLTCRPINAETGMNGYAVNGTPSDCVKIAVAHLLPKKPDAIIAGMNLGENSGTAGYYSGTVAAAREGAFWRIPSMAFSVCKEGFDFAGEYALMARQLFERIRDIHRHKAGANGAIPVYYNVNFPGCPFSKSKGVKITRQSLAFFDDRYREERDASGQARYWIYGERKDLEQSELYDTRALENGYITVTPLDFDATAVAALSFLEGLTSP